MRSGEGEGEGDRLQKRMRAWAKDGAFDMMS